VDDGARTARRLLVVDGLHLPAPSTARAVAWTGERITWVGDPRDAPPAEEVIELRGAWVTPGFVDAHVHLTATGLKLDGVDLTGAGSAAAVVDAVRAHAARRGDDPVLGSGWDDHTWRERRPPHADELGTAARGRRVLLDRVDGHSCLVDPRTLAEVAAATRDGVDRDADGRPTGWLREDAAGVARQLLWPRLDASRLDRARGAAAAHAAALGITSVHEMGVPILSTIDDAVAWATGTWPVEVLVWWADLDPHRALDRGLRPGGDLFLDGAIGSRTAAVSIGYRDGPALGGLFHDDEAVAAFFVACTRAGVGGGVHAIGDLAIEQAVTAVERAAAVVGADAVRACRHRIEHVELPRPDHPARMARLGVVASMQPAFDALWGGEAGLYAARFGVEAALASNPFADFAAAGCRLAFSSDSTVTPMAPIGGVGATAGGRHVAGQDDVGAVRSSHRADLSVWDGDPLADHGGAPPRCLGVVVRGATTLGGQRTS
jgi:predicted amidohydrolase YtcJ